MRKTFRHDAGSSPDRRSATLFYSPQADFQFPLNQHKIGWRKLRKETKPIRKEFEALLLRGQFSGNPRLQGMCKDLYAHRAWLWTFLDQQGVEPTNNTAERALRPAVIYRKLSFGAQSESGSRDLDRMLTVSESCRMQRRSAFEYLTAVMQAYYEGQPIPSLLPSSSQASAT